jgi:hypothetical protein
MVQTFCCKGSGENFLGLVRNSGADGKFRADENFRAGGKFRATGIFRAGGIFIGLAQFL